MGRLAIVRPLPIAGIGGTFPNITRALTPDPKEAAITSAAGTYTIDVDLGSQQSFDSLFLGFVGQAAFTVTYGVTTYDAFTIPGGVNSSDIASDLFSPVYHGLNIQAAPYSGRYIRFTATLPINFPIGVIAIGLKLESFWGHEWGAGRPIEDTGSAERLLGGGFGINEGVRVGGYQWTFGDLTDAELKALYALVRDRGSTRSTLVVEDPDRTAGLHERIHWGLLDRLEAYERSVPGASRWNLKIRDWA